MAVQQTTTQTILPAWYTQYAQNLTGKAMAASEEPYQRYNLPRIAGFSPEQEQAFAMAPGAAASYKPYLSTAGQLATQAGTGSFTAPGVAQQYMNPYIQQVVAGIGDTAARNLREKILPEVNRTFVGGGTFGGSRSAEFTNRAIRDANASALSQQVQALQQGYGQAADIYGSEMGRSLESARGLGALGQSAQQMGLQEAATLEGIGAQRQGLGQKSADLAYQDFVAQRDYPWTQLERMSRVAGTPSGTGSTTVTQAPGPSGWAQAGGALASIAGILGSAGVFKDGGEVEPKKSKKKPKAGLGWLKDKK